MFEMLPNRTHVWNIIIEIVLECQINSDSYWKVTNKKAFELHTKLYGSSQP